MFNTLVLWFSKEAVRKTVQRKVEDHEITVKGKKDEKLVAQSSINMVIFSFVVQLSLAVIVYMGATHIYPQNFSYFNFSILLVVIAALIESLCEPFYAIMLLKMEFKIRAKSESIAIFVKSVMIYYLVYQKMDLLAYAFAQLAYSLILLAMYAYQSESSFSSHFTLRLLPDSQDLS